MGNDKQFASFQAAVNRLCDGVKRRRTVGIFSGGKPKPQVESLVFLLTSLAEGYGRVKAENGEFMLSADVEHGQLHIYRLTVS